MFIITLGLSKNVKQFYDIVPLFKEVQYILMKVFKITNTELCRK